jgi:two-component system response regulator FlrC
MLFGHEKGSFTGASSSKPGLFEQAQNGTIFLDEIGEMPMQLQVKLLRILQERKVTRLGSLSSVDLNIRIVAATNKDLKQAILKGIFREDLYFRLSAFKLTIPPLSERPLDIIPLAEQFLKSEMGNGKLYSLSQDAKDQLVSYRWPGNVRELNNVIMRAVVLTNDEMIDTSHLIFDDLYIADDSRKSSHLIDGFSNNTLQFNQADEGLSSSESLSNVVKNSEYQTIMTALKSTRNRDQAAQILGISTRTLRHKLQRLREDGMAVTRAYAR